MKDPWGFKIPSLEQPNLPNKSSKNRRQHEKRLKFGTKLMRK
jgi:hypothetical protein